jgi:hypothetical protein
MAPFVRALVAGLIVGLVAEISNRSPRLGALLLTLPTVSILALILTWERNHDLANVSKLARETLMLVPLGLPFFVPLAFTARLGIGFWTAISLGILASSAIIGLWFAIGPKNI